MNFLPLIAVYTLFQVLVQDDLSLVQRAAQEVNALQLSPFGVFATITRGSNKQVHGCIGNWSTDLSPVSGTAIVNWVREVIPTARFKDSRRFQFNTDLNEDLSTELELNVLTLPLLEVNESSGYNNMNSGLLVVGQNGKRATYLPHVFDTDPQSWSNISLSLRDKAGLLPSEKAQFYFYNTHVIRFKVYDVLFSTRATYYLQKDVAQFYEKYYTDFVPYEFDSKSLEMRVVKEDAVRNTACLVNVLMLSTQFKDLLQQKPVVANLDYHYQQWFMYDADLSQASIFLLKAYVLLLRDGKGSTELQKRIALLEDGLYQLLLTLEPQFAMGEAVSVLSFVANAATSTQQVNKLFQACELMRSRLSSFAVRRFRRMSLDHVFELNWQTQSAYEMLKLTLSSFPQHVPFFQSYVFELSQAVLNIVSHVQTKPLETNFLAVIYECLSYLEAALPLAGQPVPNQLKRQKLKFYAGLLEERRGRFGLFYFNNSPVARLDLTGHAMFITL